MSKSIRLNIIAPGKKPISEDVISLNTTNSDGQIEFLGGHAPIISSTIPTISRYKTISGAEVKLFTSTGIISVKDNIINFCTDSIDFKEEIDVNRAKEAKERAEKRLKENSNIDRARAKRALERSIQRLKLAE